MLSLAAWRDVGPRHCLRTRHDHPDPVVAIGCLDRENGWILIGHWAAGYVPGALQETALSRSGRGTPQRSHARAKIVGDETRGLRFRQGLMNVHERTHQGLVGA